MCFIVYKRILNLVHFNLFDTKLFDHNCKLSKIIDVFDTGDLSFFIKKINDQNNYGIRNVGVGALVKRYIKENVVPALKIRSRIKLNKLVYVELEADGIYAPVSYLNGSDNEVIGAILDASLRAGVRLVDPVDAFLNVRYLGGGAVGTSDIDGPGDDCVRNWLNFLTVSVGFVYNI